MSIELYKLRIKLDVGSPGDILGYDPEWGIWHIGTTEFHTRGSIYEGEMAMLLSYLLAAKLTSLLEPYTKDEAVK